MKVLNMLFGLLVIVGALNWGLVGLFNFNLVTTLLGSVPMLVRVVYILVGVAGLWTAFTCSKSCSA